MYKKEKPLDLFALLIFLNLPFYTLLTTFCPIILLIGGWDPIYLLLYTAYQKCLQNGDIKSLSDKLICNFFKLTGFMITLATAQCVAVIMRNFVTLNCGMASSFLRLLDKCASYPACRHAHVLYQNIYMCFVIVSKFANTIVGLHVAFSIVTVIASTRTTIQALKTGDVVMGMMGVSVPLLFVIVSICVFAVGRFVLDTSSEALNRWKYQSKILGRPLLYKCLVATQPIVLRLGSVHRGILNVHMEMEYLNVVLNVVVNVVILSN